MKGIIFILAIFHLHYLSFGQFNQIGLDLNGDAKGDGYSSVGYLSSVSLSDDGKWVAIGFPGNSVKGSNSGMVKVYYYDLAKWVQVGNPIYGKNAGDAFGSSVRIIVVNGLPVITAGAPGFDGAISKENAGQVRVFGYDGVWYQIGADINGAHATNGAFGESVDIGHAEGVFWLAVGSPYTDDMGYDSGSSRVYSLTGKD